MVAPVLTQLLEEIRQAAAKADRSSGLRALLADSLSRQDEIANAIAAIEEDELLMFEDETCSVWICRYNSDVVFAPHEHRMAVHIAVYRGTEVEVLYKREQDGMRHGGNKLVKAGEVVTLGPEAIHAITADGEGQSHAIHIYEGPLTKIERNLFDWTSGETVAFTMENFHKMQRRKADMAEFKQR